MVAFKEILPYIILYYNIIVSIFTLSMSCGVVCNALALCTNPRALAVVVSIYRRRTFRISSCGKYLLSRRASQTILMARSDRPFGCRWPAIVVSRYTTQPDRRHTSQRSGSQYSCDAYDNAMCESFFATLECELLAGHRLA